MGCKPHVMSRPGHIRRRDEAGFSLLETIAAILLLALAFGAVMHVAGAATEATGRAREMNRIAMWADTTLDAAGRLGPIREGTQQGMYDARHRWRTIISAQDPIPGQAPDLHVYRIDLDITWRDGSAERSAHFAMLRVQDEPKPVSATSVAGP
jgi:general secretion pathway protein I